MYKFKSFVFGVLSNFSIGLIGQIWLSEIISFISLPFISLKGLFKENRQLKFVVKLLMFYLFIQILSDFINNSSSEDFIRGWAMIIFAGISCVFYTYIGSRNAKSFIYIFLGLFFIKLVLGESDISLFGNDWNDNFFKNRFIPFLNPLIFVLSYYFFNKKRYLFTVYLLIIYALICFVFNGRSNGMIFFIAGLLIFIKIKRISISPLSIIVGLSILYLSYIFYINKVLDGTLASSNSKRQVEKMGNPYNPFELLYYGRPDTVVLFKAIMDKPWFGHGSWGKDKDNKYATLLAVFSKSNHESEIGYIRAHSIILGVWAYAGIFGFSVVFILFWKLFKMYYQIYKSPKMLPYYPILVIFFIQMAWNFVFSPLGHLRTSFPLFTALIIVEYNRIELLNIKK